MRKFLFLGFAAALIALSPALVTSASAQSASPTIVAPEPAEGSNLDNGSGSDKTAQPGEATVSSITVEGTQRIEPETVLSYMTIKQGDPIRATLINSSLKALFATGLFADVKIDRKGDGLIVKVTENPIINRIAFEGNDKISDETLTNEVTLRPRIVYTRTRVQNDVKRILDLYRRGGRFAATVEPKVIRLEQNRVDLVFEIKEGPVTGIRKISFVGNRYFSDNALKDVIATKESRWYRFLSNSDTYDPDKLNYDRELLRRYYLANGFADFRVVSAVAELTEDRKDFYITFTIDEGARYKFGTFDVKSKIADVDPKPLKDGIELETGDWYNADAVDSTVIKMTEKLGDYGYAFVDVFPDVERDTEKHIINITFNVEEGPKVYVERIDIRGNVRTLDKVVRREFQLVEGDAFNSSRLRRSRQRIQDLGFFKSVEVNNVPGSTPDKTVVQVDVEEQSTGELTIGGGYSTTAGALGDFSIRERNLMGKGQDMFLSTRIGQKEQYVDFKFTEPYFMDMPLRAGIDIFHRQKDNQDTSSYDFKDTGGGFRFGYDITDYWGQSLNYKFSRETIDNVKDTASRFIREERGTAYASVLGQDLSYDRRNSKSDPTDGYMVSLGTDLAGLGGTVKYVRTTLTGDYYLPITDNVVTRFNGRLGYIAGWGGKSVRLNDRFYLGGDTLRGFQTAGVGPRDVTTDDSLGGKRLAAGTVELSFPLGLPEEFGLKGALFSDFGSLSSIDETGSEIRDNNGLRASVGVGVNWVSPVGPIRVDFSQAVKKESYDKTEVFRFSFGTRF